MTCRDEVDIMASPFKVKKKKTCSKVSFSRQ